MSVQPLILIADDEEDFREIFSAKLSATGYRIEHAEDGVEALKKARELKPDLILMDMRMPNMTGAEALLALKGDDSTKKTKVLFLSNLGDPLPEVQKLNDRFASQIGAIGYLRKTDDLETLVSKIRDVLKS